MRLYRTLVLLAGLLAAASSSQAQTARVKPKPTKSAPPAESWKPLFDGKTLGDWKRTEFRGGGEIKVSTQFNGEKPAILVESGRSLSGFNWTGEAPPKTNYEISLEAIKIQGGDFFCGLTFPVGDSYASLIIGGWGGNVTGISSINGMDASENETTKGIYYDLNRWYKIRLRVTPAAIEAWLDARKIVNLPLEDKKISLRIGEISKSVPLGLSTYQTKGAFRAIKIRKIESK